jgi:hypothetical protein
MELALTTASACINSLSLEIIVSGIQVVRLSSIIFQVVRGVIRSDSCLVDLENMILICT